MEANTMKAFLYYLLLTLATGFPALLILIIGC